MITQKPLVSIMIPNKDHARFLGPCIESALSQTYDNIDIVVLDNCSEDNSVEVASKYIKHGVRVCKNAHNIINNNYKVLDRLTKGDYMILLCADDLIKPTALEKCVNIMEHHPNVGYVHFERDYVDAHGNITELDPFYNASFIAPGEAALPIYLLTDVAQPAQCLIRRSVFTQMLGYNTEFDHTNADKELWFKLSLASDYAYIREKLSLIRIHDARESVIGFNNFFHPLAMYLSIDSQVNRGMLKNHQNVVDRAPAAYDKLAQESLHIARSCLNQGNRTLAKKYILFSQIVSDTIDTTDIFQNVMFKLNNPDNHKGGQNPEQVFIARKRNYPPPDGFTTLTESQYS
jgi:glycosyltransferase involved in cell wall biosynthesis